MDGTAGLGLQPQQVGKGTQAFAQGTHNIITARGVRM